MNLNLKGKFADKKQFDKYFGLTGVRILTKEDGTPYINPTEAELAAVFEGYEAKEEEKKYHSSAKITSGWTDFASNGGKQRKSEKQFEELSMMDKDNYVTAEEIWYTNVTFVIETLGQKPLRKLLTFRLFDAEDITRKGDKIKVFNKYGQTAYRTADGIVPEFFAATEEDLVRQCPMSRSAMDFEALINFLYAYSSLSKKEALLGGLDLESVAEGDVSSIEDIVVAIHDGIVNDKDQPLYGAMLLLLVENNDGTRNEDVQGYFPAFERAIIDKDGTYNKDCPLIHKELAKARKPQSNGKVYSPESKGQFVGHDGLPPIGLKIFKPEFAKALKAQSMAATAAPTPALPAQVNSDDNSYF